MADERVPDVVWTRPGEAIRLFLLVAAVATAATAATLTVGYAALALLLAAAPLALARRNQTR